MPRPEPGTFAAYYTNYIAKVKEDELLPAFDVQQNLMEDFFRGISEEKANYAYAPGKWTIKELLQHVIDTERVFSYRAMCIARGEKQSLPGFDENEYAATSKANDRHWNDMLEEMISVRLSSRLLFSSFDDEQLTKTGTANNNKLGVLAAGYIILGHVYHHVQILQERYL
ncbi:MAG: DinB family protein [Ferruginibacter sp.]